MIDENISKLIFERADSMEYCCIFYTSFIRFTAEVDPLSFMSEEDYYGDVYEDQLIEAQEKYREKYKKEFLKESFV